VPSSALDVLTAYEGPEDETLRLTDETVDLSIDGLARRTGTTTRNIRALQSASCLLRPEILGRTAHYYDSHLDRLETVLRLQGSGFSLAAIRALFDAERQGRSLGDVLGRSSSGPQHPKRTLRLLSDVPSNLLDPDA
jgi:DNA-binding transcriptional MerR regulator